LIAIGFGAGKQKNLYFCALVLSLGLLLADGGIKAAVAGDL
jgi:hypothetical protein